MATTPPSSPTPSTSTNGPSPSSAYTPTEWTQQTMFGDLMQQKGLLIGVGVLVVCFLFFRGRSRPDEKAARRLVRDWRHVDDPDDARDLLGENLPPVLRPALLIALEEIERQVQRGLRRVEREVERL